MKTLNPPLPLADITSRCRQVQQSWARLTVGERLRPLRTFRRLIYEHQDSLADAVLRDLGKPIEETLGAEVLSLTAACRFLEQEAVKLLRPRRVPGRLRPMWLMGQADTVHRRPRGLIGLIGTWNYPLYLNGVTLAQALTAGNGVVWKPSEVAPASADALFDLICKSGYPNDLVQKLPALREMGKELAEADVDFVSFTGSSGTGRMLATTLARRLIPSTLELSGCDAVFILEDADLTMAARAVWFGATVNRGQTCLAARRVFVQRRVYQPFLDALRPLAESGQPQRLALAAQAEQARRLVREACSEGARLLVEPRGDEHAEICLPRIVVDARPEMSLCREAAFAPVMAVLPFDTVDEALERDAQCSYALGASIFTRTPDRAASWVDRLRTGTVTFNDLIASTAHPATPFGGTRESGWGVTQGAEGLLELTVPQVVSVRSGTYRPHYDLTGGPDASQGEMVRGLLAYENAPSWRQRLAGLWRVVKAMRSKKT